MLILPEQPPDLRSLTSAITANTVHKLILAHLEHATIAGFASAVMTTMPRATGTISDLPLFCSLSNGNHSANDFMPGDDWKLGPWRCQQLYPSYSNILSYMKLNSPSRSEASYQLSC